MTDCFQATRFRLAVTFAALVLLPGCLKLPSWETYVTIPLVSDTLRPVDLFDSTLFRMTDSSVDLHVELEFDTVYASDNFGRFGISDMFAFPLGAFTLPRFIGLSDGYAIWDVRGIQPDDSVIIRFGDYSREYPFVFPLPGMDTAVLGGGAIFVQVDNRTRVPLHRVKLVLDGIGTWLLGTADTMARTGLRLDLTGIHLDGMISGRLLLISLGTGEEEVLICHADSVLVELAMDSVRLRSGRLLANSLLPMMVDADYSRALEMDQRLVVDSALFSEGDMEFVFESTMPVNIEVNLTVHELGFDSTLVIAADTTTVCEIGLPQCCYRNADPDSNRLSASVTARLLPAGEPVELSEANWLRVSMEDTGLRTAYIHGTARDTVWTTRYSETVIVGQPSRLARLRLSTLWLNACARNAVGFPCVMELTVAARTQSGDSTTVKLLAELPPGTVEVPAIGGATADATGLLGVEANRFRFGARFGLTGSGSIRYPSWTASSALLAAPLRVQLLADTISFGPWLLPIPSAARSKPGQELLGGELVVPVTGRFPFGMTGALELTGAGHSNMVFDITIPSGVVDPKRGVVVAPRDSVLVFEFGGETQRIFHGSTISVKLDLFVPETDTVLLTPADHFRIDESYARVRMKVGRK